MDFLTLWAFCRYDLGLSEHDIESLSLSEITALIKRYEVHQEVLDARTALICTVIANCHRGKHRAFKVSDYMPKKPKKQTKAEMFTQLKMIAAAHKGKDNVKRNK